LVVPAKKVTADQREAPTSFNLLPPGKDFDFLVVPPRKVTADQREAPRPSIFASRKDFDFLVVPPKKVTADQREAPQRPSAFRIS